jgi:chemotaxis protein MotA
VLLSNLVFKPVAVKLERRTEQRVVLMNMIMQGVSMMSQRRGPALMRETLNSFMAQYQDEINDRGGRDDDADPAPERG